jgi:hypothetical protein
MVDSLERSSSSIELAAYPMVVPSSSLRRSASQPILSLSLPSRVSTPSIKEDFAGGGYVELKVRSIKNPGYVDRIRVPWLAVQKILKDDSSLRKRLSRKGLLFGLAITIIALAILIPCHVHLTPFKYGCITILPPLIGYKLGKNLAESDSEFDRYERVQDALMARYSLSESQSSDLIQDCVVPDKPVPEGERRTIYYYD